MHLRAVSLEKPKEFLEHIFSDSRQNHEMDSANSQHFQTIEFVYHFVNGRQNTQCPNTIWGCLDGFTGVTHALDFFSQQVLIFN